MCFIHIHFIAVIIFHRNKLLFDNSEKSIAPFVLPSKQAGKQTSERTNELAERTCVICVGRSIAATATTQITKKHTEMCGMK